MLLAATIAIWVSFLVVAALRPEPTATRPGGPGRPVVLVPTDLLTFSTLVVRIRLAPLAMVLVLLLRVLPLASEWAGCKRFNLFIGVTDTEAVTAVFCCCIFDCCSCCVGVLTAGGLLLIVELLLVAVLLLFVWTLLLLVALLVFHGHWWGWYCCLIVRFVACVCGAILAPMEAVLMVTLGDLGDGKLIRLFSFLSLVLLLLLLLTDSDVNCIGLPALT